ncbi:MAG: ImmA/IrrE family metallo-endopeptidase [Ignavibacteriae bacterium]|nr:ImmA/IrrE family metallo-endopeptidase [Ignavibacteriota bacterium]
MASKKQFQPNWASAPGDTIADILEERKLSVIEFAEHMSQTIEDANDLLQGRATITMAVARRLERVLGASVEFWMSRDFQYREDISKLRAADKKWIRELPLGDMIRFGWLKSVPHPTDEVNACLRFFDVPSVSAWYEKYASLRERVAFRTSPSFDSRPAAVATWLRRGEILAEDTQCRPWNENRFQTTLTAIRSLTRRKDPSSFIPELQRHCAESGVAVIVVRAPSGCRASGATQFLSREKALLLLSFRHLTDDHFWFSFFHEAGHLLLHGKARLFLEDIDSPTMTEEQQANEFAARALVPIEFQPALLKLPADGRKVIKFAVNIGVSPGIIVGQLQHFNRIRRDQLNKLKRRFTWKD